MKEPIEVQIKTSSIQDFEEWLEKDKRAWTIIILDDNNAIIKKFDKEQIK